MKNILPIVKPVGFMLAIFLFMLSGPCQFAMAAMVGTEAVNDIKRSQNAREYLKSFLAREEVKNTLVSRGIDLQEAKNRIDGLTDEEAARVADQLQELPAGGSFFTTLLIVVFLIFIILLITDITGYTDVFPFVKAHR